jgi:putative spermidine/putrescine transport system substrate-binding protein
MSDVKVPSTPAQPDSKRRTLLKGVVAAGGVMGFPYVHAQEKITLRYLGTAVNQDKAIGDKFKADTGISIQYIPVTTDDVTKRAVTAPNSFDLIDTEYFSLKKIIPTGNLLGIDTKRIKNADKITTLFTRGEVAGKKVGDQGTAPKKVMYLEKPNSKTFSAAPTQYMTLIPTVYNADTLGIRPDLIKRPIESWKELLNPEFKGKAAILNIPSIGIMDAAMVVEASGLHKYPDKGNMT